MRRTVPPSAEIEQQIDQLLAVGVGENPRESLSELAKLGARLIIQRAVEDEFDAWLGRARYERRPAYQRGLRNFDSGLRNGFRPRRVQTLEGELEVEIPQVREAAEPFVSKLFPCSTKVLRTEPLRAMVIGAFVRGLSMRDIESLCEKAGVGKLSKATAQRICSELRERFEAFKRRDLYTRFARLLAPMQSSPTTSDGAAIVVRDLEVRRNSKRVLPGISLTIPRGTVTGLLGPSGSGKTTLMRAVVGVQIIAGGEVTVLGRPAGSPELRRRVGYMTQVPSVYGDLTVRENLEYFARVVRAPVSRIEEAIATVGLEAEADQVVRTLSGGQRSRCSLAAALLGEPDVLVLDEPTVGLDPVLRAELWQTFHVLAAEGATLLVSTHVMDEASRCDELILQREGEIVAADPPQRLHVHSKEGVRDHAIAGTAAFTLYRRWWTRGVWIAS